MLRYDMAYIGQVRNKKTKELHDFMDRSQRQLVHGSHLEQRIFAGTKWFGRYEVQASRFMAQVIALVLLMQWLVMIEKLG